MGEIVGAPRSMMLRRITFPLVLPAILSSFILIFSKAMGTFGVPAFLGMKVSYYTISTMLYSSIKQQQTAVAYTISLILIAIAAVVIFINQRALGTRKSYATIGGQGRALQCTFPQKMERAHHRRPIRIPGMRGASAHRYPDSAKPDAQTG